ncbi:hypothetical protein MACK_000914 [Theileria orientalis]|uniref:Uncharacterized protein n=1 Tax=Theileria orientalis TaxID=68886 RepID=A0A976MCF6_THEOR|nr:hypothetical protein MACK_000914 [Theileria orientalis]
MERKSGDSNGQNRVNRTSQNNKVHSANNRGHVSNRGSEENGKALSTPRTTIRGSLDQQRSPCRPRAENSDRHNENSRSQHLNSENHHREPKLNGVVREGRASSETRTVRNHISSSSNSLVLSEETRRCEDDIRRLVRILSTGKARSVMAVAKSLLRAVSEAQSTFTKSWITNGTPSNSTNAAVLNNHNGSHENMDNTQVPLLSRINNESNKIVTFYRYRELENYLEIFHSQEIPPVNRKFNDEELEEQLEILLSNINLRLQSFTRYLYFLKSNSVENIREVIEYHNSTGMVNEIASHNELSQIISNLLHRSENVDKLITLASSHNFIIYRLIFVITKIRNRYIRMNVFRKELDDLDIVIRLMADYCNLSRVLTIMEFKNDDMITLLGKLTAKARDTGAVLEWILSIKLDDYSQTYQMSISTDSTYRASGEENNVESEEVQNVEVESAVVESEEVQNVEVESAVVESEEVQNVEVESAVVESEEVQNVEVESAVVESEEVQNVEVDSEDDFELIVDDPVDAQPLEVPPASVEQPQVTVNSSFDVASGQTDEPSSGSIVTIVSFNDFMARLSYMQATDPELSSCFEQNETETNSASFQTEETSALEIPNVQTHSGGEQQQEVFVNTAEHFADVESEEVQNVEVESAVVESEEVQNVEVESAVVESEEVQNVEVESAVVESEEVQNVEVESAVVESEEVQNVEVESAVVESEEVQNVEVESAVVESEEVQNVEVESAVVESEEVQNVEVESAVVESEEVQNVEVESAVVESEEVQNVEVESAVLESEEVQNVEVESAMLESVDQRRDASTRNNHRLTRSGNGGNRYHNGKGGKKSKAKNKGKAKRPVRAPAAPISGQDSFVESIMNTHVYPQLEEETAEEVPSESARATEMPSDTNGQETISEGASGSASPTGDVKTDVGDRAGVDETPSTSTSDPVRGTPRPSDEESSDDSERTPVSDVIQILDVQPARQEPLSTDSVSDAGSNSSPNGSSGRSTGPSLSSNPRPQSTLTNTGSTNPQSQQNRVRSSQEPSSTGPNGRRDRTSRGNQVRGRQSNSTGGRGQPRDRAGRERPQREATPEQANNRAPVVNGYLYLHKVFEAKSVEPHAAVLNLLKLLNKEIVRNELNSNPMEEATIRQVLKMLETLEQDITAISWQLSSIAESTKVLEASTRNMILGQDVDGQLGKDSKKLVCGMLHEWDSVSTRLHDVATQSVCVNNMIEANSLRSDHLIRKLGHINNLLDCVMNDRTQCLAKITMLSERLCKKDQPTNEANGSENNAGNNTSEETAGQGEEAPLTPEPNERVMELLNSCLKDQMRSREMEQQSLYNGVSSIHI